MAAVRHIPLSREQILVVQDTWTKLEPLGGQVGQLFYARLFEIDPSLHAQLTETLGREERLDLRLEDATTLDWLSLATVAEGSARTHFVANLPYESATPILLRWLEASAQEGLGVPASKLGSRITSGWVVHSQPSST